jgi:hypothetical protein
MSVRREQIQREERAMRLVVRKLEVLDVGQLQSLVMEHLDGIEPGLTVVDSRLLLGHATVDIVALDADGTLVLVTTGFTADEEMLLKAVEAYSWCLEYPDAIRRLYPSVEVSAARPPRLMFVVERLPDAFHRKIKQLGFSEVDCVEFRHLDVSGTPAAYFDTIARLRRGSAQAEFQPAPIARRVSEAPTRRAPAMPPAERAVDHSDKVVPLPSVPSARATSVRLQKMLNTTGPSHGNGVAPVIDIAARSAVPAPRPNVSRVEAPRFEASHVELAEPEPEIASPQIDAVAVETIEPLQMADEPVEIAEPEIELAVETTPTLELEQSIVTAAIDETIDVAADAEPSVVEPVARIALREAIPAPAPVAAAPAVAESAEPRVSFAEIASELLGKITSPTDSAIALDDAAAASKTEAVEIELSTDVERETTIPATSTPAAPVETKPTPAVAPKPVFTAPKPAPTIKPIAPETKPVAPTLKPIAPAPKPVAPAPKPVVPAPKPVIAAPKPAVATAKPTVAAPAPAAAKPAAAAKPTAPDTAPSLPQEFEGLKFPNDGVLTRQWMEFLNQMASNK